MPEMSTPYFTEEDLNDLIEAFEKGKNKEVYDKDNQEHSKLMESVNSVIRKINNLAQNITELESFNRRGTKNIVNMRGGKNGWTDHYLKPLCIDNLCIDEHTENLPVFKLCFISNNHDPYMYFVLSGALKDTSGGDDYLTQPLEFYKNELLKLSEQEIVEKLKKYFLEHKKPLRETCRTV